MTLPDHDTEDTQWLKALAGKPHDDAPASINQQAAAVRKALQARARMKDQDVPNADEQLFQQSLFRLKQAGLLRRAPVWRQPTVWGLAASLFLCVGVVLQMQVGLGDEDERLQMRGAGGHATVMLVAEPEARLTELLQGLKASGASVQIARPKAGQISLTITVVPGVLDYLTEQRIDPAVVNGRVDLVLQGPGTIVVPRP
jgi:hypothetical protein